MNVTIGMIGGGQLGKMIAQEAKRMAMNMVVLDPTPDCPAAQIAGKQIVADFKDTAAIRRLAQASDVITYEIELGNTDILKSLEQEGFKIFPSAETLRIIQDKLLQKQYLRQNGIPVPEFCEVASIESLTQCLSKFGFPSVLKRRFDAYDGRGNYTLQNMQDLVDLSKAHSWNGNFSEQKFMLEKFVAFDQEVSVMVARNQAGDTTAYPVVENLHHEHILSMTIAPARVGPHVAEEARRVALRAVEALNGVGIFGVEMFVDADGKVLVNEISPRPHNSGHYTIEACTHSQFEMHLRAILDLPLVEPQLLAPAVMLNLLGQEDSDAPYEVEGIEQLLAIPGVKLHLYGKRGQRRKRKLGHITILDLTLEGALEKAEKVRGLVRIKVREGA